MDFYQYTYYDMSYVFMEVFSHLLKYWIHLTIQQISRLGSIIYIFCPPNFLSITDSWIRYIILYLAFVEYPVSNC